MELQGHILIPEFYSSALISPHVYKWCKTSTVVSLIQNKLLFYGKNYTSYLHRQPIFSKQELKLKLTTKISKTEKLLQFKLFQEKWTHNTYYKSDLCGGLQLVPSLTSLTQSLGNLLSLRHDLRSHMGKLTLKYLQFMCCSWKIKPGLFASVTLPRTPLFQSQFTHLSGMCFCVLKKQLLCHPRFRCCLWILPPSPQGVLLAIIPSWSKLTWVLKCCSVHHYEKPVSVSYSHLNHAAPKQGNSCSKRRQPLEHRGACWNSGSSQPEAKSWGMCWEQPHHDTSSSCRPLGSHCSLA